MDYLFALQTARESWASFLTPVFYVISEFSFYGVPLIVLVLYTCINKKKFEHMAFSLITANFLMNTIKLIACVYRPWVKDSRIVVDSLAEHSATGYSFPSGHTTSGATFYGSLAVNERNGKKRKWVLALLFILIALTAFSRNWLGAHTISDVFWAVILAAFSLFFCDKLLSYIEKNPEKDLLIVITGLLINVAAMVYFLAKSYPMDYAADGTLLVDPIATQKDSWLACGFAIAWLICWYWDRHGIHFTTDLSPKQKTIRAIISTLIFALFYEFVMKKIMNMMDIRIGALLRGFVSVAIVAGILPWIFTKIENRKG